MLHIDISHWDPRALVHSPHPACADGIENEAKPLTDAVVELLLPS
jgi:hypothetical protein